MSQLCAGSNQPLYLELAPGTTHFHDGALTTHPIGGLFNDGVEPVAPLCLCTDGNLYGTTSYGGTVPGADGQGLGTLFRITPGGRYKILYNFGTKPDDGTNPAAGMILTAPDTLVGTTSQGGFYKQGTVFEATPSRMVAAGSAPVIFLQ